MPVSTSLLALPLSLLISHLSTYLYLNTTSLVSSYLISSKRVDMSMVHGDTAAAAPPPPPPPTPPPPSPLQVCVMTVTGCAFTSSLQLLPE